MDAATRRPRRRPAPVGSPSRRGQRDEGPLQRCLFHPQPALLPRHKGACSEVNYIHLSLIAALRNRECARVARPCIVQDAITSPPQVPMALVSALATQALGWYKCSMPASGRRRKAPKPLPQGGAFQRRSYAGTERHARTPGAGCSESQRHEPGIEPSAGRDSFSTSASSRWVVVVHVVQIEEAARGNLAPGKRPSQ